MRPVTLLILGRFEKRSANPSFCIFIDDVHVTLLGLGLVRQTFN
jgi:hypothetical protein